MDSYLKQIVFGVILGLTTTCVIYTCVTTLFMDCRYYAQIYKQCETKGFIQDKTTRIMCSIETKK